jgi:branched-chain amino acid transport system permease protein
MRRVQFIIASVLLGLALFVPIVIRTDYTLQVVFRVFLFAGLGLAWNWVGGYSGQLSLGHAAYFGLGAYGLSLFTKLGMSMWLALLLAILLSVFFAAIIGTVSFRLRGPYFALCTIAFAEVLRLTAKNLPNVTGGDVGTQVPLLFTHATMQSFYYAGVLLAILALALTWWIEGAKFGYYLMAIREDEDTALSVGVNTPRMKLYALLISAAVTAIGGALYASIFLFIVPDQVLSMEISTEIAIVPMLGGAGTMLGPIVGSIILESASEIFKAYFQEANLLIYGVLIVVVVLFLPEGIVGTVSQKLREFKHAPTPPFAEKTRVGPEEEATRAAIVDVE